MEISIPGPGREQKEPIPSMKSGQGVILFWLSSHPFCLNAIVAGKPWATKRRHLTVSDSKGSLAFPWMSITSGSLIWLDVL